MEIEKYQFCDIQLSDRALIENICALNGGTLYSHTFHVMYLWKDLWKLSICVEDDFFVAKVLLDGVEGYFSPCGNPDKKIEFLKWFIDNKSNDCILCNISEDDKDFIEAHTDGELSLEFAREDCPYIYDKNEQLEMQGKKYRNMRGSLRKSTRGYEWSSACIDKDNISDVRFIVDTWINKDSTDRHDKKSVKLALDNFFELGMFGVILYRDGEPCAFSMGSFTNENTFDLNISKSIVPSVDLLLRRELFKLLPEDVLFIDQEDDMGIEGLRMHKSLLNPIEIREVWVYKPNTCDTY